jgi:threonine 3-dehydrogenase
MAQTMKALVKREAAKGHLDGTGAGAGARLQRVLIKLEKTAICGTDLHIYKWDEWSQRVIKPGLVIGHEFVGRIVELGQGVHRLQDRRPRSAEGHIVCGHCRNLPRRPPAPVPNTVGIGVNRTGAFAEYIVDARFEFVADPGPDSRPSWPPSSIPTATPRTARSSST